MVDVLKGLFSERVLAIDAESLLYRGILVAGMLLMALAMRTLWQIYESWGEG
jgi:hypothetical protein